MAHPNVVLFDVRVGFHSRLKLGTFPGGLGRSAHVVPVATAWLVQAAVVGTGILPTATTFIPPCGGAVFGGRPAKTPVKVTPFAVARRARVRLPNLPARFTNR